MLHRGCEWGTRNGFSSLFAQKKNVLNPYFWQMIREIIRFKQDVIRVLLFLSFVALWSPPIAHCKMAITYRQGCTIDCIDGATDVYDGCIIAVRATDSLRMLGKEATFDETRILGAFQYVYSDVFLHHDKTFLPRNTTTWCACNFPGTTNNRGCVTYWLNIIQLEVFSLNLSTRLNLRNLGDSKLPYLVTLDPPHTPEHTLLKWTTSHPVPSVAASKASCELYQIQGNRGIWFFGAYQGYGFHEDGLKVGVAAADGMLKRNCCILDNPKHMVPTWPETGARLLVARFLKSFIQTGCIILLEGGGKIFTFQGTEKKCSLKVSLRVHNTICLGLSRIQQFLLSLTNLLQVATRANLGIADVFIHGDISFVNKNEGLLNLFMIYVANRDLKASVKRGWWTPLLDLPSAKYFIGHVSNRNTLTQARRNISRHYDLSNELFSLFLDETMAYSCASFKSEDEDLKDAQLRNLSVLIKKAKISKKHHILEIGFGWGSFAVEVFKQTGCKYTGITLSEQQLEYAQLKVEQAGLQDRITLLLCDYRQMPNKDKYDKIISIGMIEHVGHDYIEEFFTCCESALAEDGLLVLQFFSIPDERYDSHRQSTDFMRDYIFPGGCLPALSRIISGMAAASKLCVVHVEEIGIHYYQTLRCWRNNFLKNKRQIRALGFDDKFIRTWEYYFDYCAAGFKTHTFGDYQIVFSRPGNVATFGDPYNVTVSTVY
ncbi:hypothetical protein MTR67_041450 [Solanum verrucosum]|uniref:Cyclopropane fatty acid synthase n=1 Tax=Solanum verrucosum TaxID=315347 RepID=A0AAF0ZSR1_SOLVR|nr:hypothetical protein MTR67_041450 [Solanum verrucosum]